jgi:hypothetical protein
MTAYHQMALLTLASPFVLVRMMEHRFDPKSILAFPYDGHYLKLGSEYAE